MGGGWSRDDIVGLLRQGKVKLRVPNNREGAAEAVSFQRVPCRTRTQAEDAALKKLRRMGWPEPADTVPVVTLASGHRYTADFWFPALRILVEVKGAKHPSYQASRVRFDEAQKVAPPDWLWVWMERRKPSRLRPSGYWSIDAGA